MKIFIFLFFTSICLLRADESKGIGDSAAATGGLRPPQMNEGFIGRDVPSFDPGNEVLGMDGKLWNINNNRLLRARFEKFLNAPPASEFADQQYHSNIERIMDLLTPRSVNNQKIDQALSLLSKTSTYRDDANLSRTLSDAIHSAQENIREIDKLKRDNIQLERELQKAEWNLKMASAPKQLNIASGNNEKDNSKLEQLKDEQAVIVSQAQRKFSEISQTIENNKARIALTELTSKGHLQSLIIQLFATRRFQHTIIANRFYRAIFTDGDNSLDAYKRSVEQLPTNRDAGFATIKAELDPRVSGELKGGTYVHGGSVAGDEVRGGGVSYVPMSQSMEASGMKLGVQNLSVESFVGGAASAAQAVSKLVSSLSQIDALANEAIRDVDEGVEVFKYLVEQRELKSASERLAETFMIGEFMPSVKLIDRNEKRKVLDFLHKSNQLLSALEVNDLELAESLVKQISEIAVDFDATKALAKIETAKVVSSMQIARAKSSAISGDNEKMEGDIVAAMNTWQRNPELAKASEMLFNQADVQQRALVDFDQLLSQKNYRQIFDDRARFIAATATYPERAAELEKVLQQMTLIEAAILRAQEIDRRGDPIGAWESVERAHLEFPEDSKLSTLRADLTTRAADFVQRLRRAQELEQRGQMGSSLAWFLQAQQAYPPSDFAREGIARIVPIIFPDDISGSRR